jgi:hypothetical protein
VYCIACAKSGWLYILLGFYSSELHKPATPNNTSTQKTCPLLLYDSLRLFTIIMPDIDQVSTVRIRCESLTRRHIYYDGLLQHLTVIFLRSLFPV